MIELVAQALHEVSFSDSAWGDLPELGSTGRDGYRDRARIVLKRMIDAGLPIALIPTPRDASIKN